MNNAPPKTESFTEDDTRRDDHENASNSNQSGSGFPPNNNNNNTSTSPGPPNDPNESNASNNKHNIPNDTIASSFDNTFNSANNIDFAILSPEQIKAVKSLIESYLNKINAAQSEKGYHEISEKIVNCTTEYLFSQFENKITIRHNFMDYFKNLLGIQYIALAFLIFLSSSECIPFHISDTLFYTYVTSVFVETLGVILVMVYFAFSGKEENTILGILTNVIQNYQKYKTADPKEMNHKEQLTNKTNARKKNKTRH